VNLSQRYVALARNNQRKINAKCHRRHRINLGT